MTDTPPGTTLTDPPKDSSAQMIVALTTVAGMVIIAVSALVVAWLARTIPAVSAASGGIATAIAGGLVNSLNSPTGVASVIASARKAVQS